MQSHHVMSDHPSWTTREDHSMERVVRCGSSVWRVTTTAVPNGIDYTTELLSGSGDCPPHWDVADPANLVGPGELVEPLREAGTVARLRNPDLWDAAATSVIRQVIRAKQARKLYRNFAAEYGECVEGNYGPLWLFPRPEHVLSLPDSEFARLGLAFKRQPLRSLADAYEQLGSKWEDFHAANLIDELQSVKRIGPWTACATVADFTNDYRYYPYGDLAVRTWAERIAPFIHWPTTEPEFARMWESIAGEQLSNWTLLTLAWGVRHAKGPAI